MKEKWIKLHSKFLNWEWYQDKNTKILFIHCLLKANWKDGSFEGIEIPRGSFVTSRKKLAEELEISEQSIRTSLNKLKSTNEITIKSTNKFTIITIVNYKEYQKKQETITNEITDIAPNEQPTTNQQLTTIEEYKNNKNEINSVFNNSETENICHFKLVEKCEGCFDCMKKKICKNPTSSEFLLRHNGQAFEEYDAQRTEKMNQIASMKSQEDLDLEILDYDFLEDSGGRNG